MGTKTPVLAVVAGLLLADALKYFYRFAGYGGVPYGDQRPGGGPATGGIGGRGNVVRPHQISAAAKIENCTAVDTQGSLKHKVGRQISHWHNSADAYTRVGDASAKDMIELLTKNET